MDHPALAEAPSPVSGWPDTAVSVRLRRGAGGAVRADGVLCSAPLWVRWDGTTLWLVGSGASPVGEDHVRMHLDVGPGVAVTVRSVAATIVYAARGAGTRWDTDIRVGAGAVLDWRPEPVILTERARHEATTTVRAEPGASVLLDETLVLGRAGEAPGLVRSTLAVHLAGAPVMLTSVDTSLPGWSGPAGTDGRSVVGHRLRVEADGPRRPHGPPAAPEVGSDGVVLDPAPGCRLAVAASDDVGVMRTVINGLLPA